MNYSDWFKHLCKMAILLIVAIVFRPLLDMTVILRIKLGPLLANWLGSTGGILMVLIEVIGIPLLIAAIIGVLGGLWIGGRSINGFILSLAFYLVGFTMGITTLGLRFDLITLLLFIGLLIVPMVGTVVYAIFSKWHPAKQCAVTTVSTT